MIFRKAQFNRNEMNRVINSLITEVRRRIAIDQEHEFKIKLVSKELLTNIFSYSNAENIELSAGIKDGFLAIIIENDGEGFCYQEVLQKNPSRDCGIMLDNGRGIFLVRKMSDGLTFSNKGNRVEVILNLNVEDKISKNIAKQNVL